MLFFLLFFSEGTVPSWSHLGHLLLTRQNFSQEPDFFSHDSRALWWHVSHVSQRAKNGSILAFNIHWNLRGRNHKIITFQMCGPKSEAPEAVPGVKATQSVSDKTRRSAAQLSPVPHPPRHLAHSSFQAYSFISNSTVKPSMTALILGFLYIRMLRHKRRCAGMYQKRQLTEMKDSVATEKTRA